MVVGKEKPLVEIIEMIKKYKMILNTGCAGCTAVCLAGGMKEVLQLNLEITAVLKKEDITPVLDAHTVERQCDALFLAEFDKKIKDYDAVLSMACGAGVQFLAERYPEKPVFPALNTVFIGINRGIGLYEENCRSCGDCYLAYTAGICPVTRCAKSIFNGPCGGSQDGVCEVDPNIPCAWCEIYKRLKAQNRLENIFSLKQPVQWKNQVQGTLVQKGYEKKYQ